MKKIISNEVKEYVMNDMVWKVDLPALIKESAECSKGGLYASCWNLLYGVLQMLVQRAIELNDPALNIIMLNLSLYEGSHDKDIRETIDKLRNEITKDE